MDTFEPDPSGPRAFFARIQGRVQGVGFRYTAYDKAHSLGLAGWVRNSFEGDVEVFAEGPQEKLDAFLSWLRRGPPMARVDSVDAESRPPEGRRGFSITH